MSTSAVTPFVDDEDDEESLYSVGGTSDDSSQKLGPDGDGAASNSGSQMPQYSSQQSGSTNPENNAPANSGGKSAGADPLAGSLYQPPPAAPAARSVDRSRFNSDEDQYATDSATLDRGKYKPSVSDYIRGGLVGALSGALGQDPAPGREIVNRKYSQAATDQQQREKADQQRLAQDEKDVQFQGQDIDRERELYDTNLQRYNANRGAQQQEWERQHTLQQDKTAAGNTTWQHQHETDAAAETARHNKADENNALGELGVRSREASTQEKRLKDEEDWAANGGSGRPGSPTDQRLREQNASKYQATRQAAFDKINHGDPKAADEESQLGYQENLRRLNTSTENPETGEKWQPGEREAATKALNQRHLDALNQVETDYVDSMHGMGFRGIQPIRFNDQGEAMTDSSGQPLNRQRVGGAPQQQPNAPPPQQARPPQQQVFRRRRAASR
jgi:hypothetical protein